MSRHINVNPGQYKVAGRERQGEAIVHEVEKARARRREPPRQPAPSPPVRRSSGKVAASGKPKK